MPQCSNRISILTTRCRYGVAVNIPSPPLEERARERRLFVSKFLCHGTSSFFCYPIAVCAGVALLIYGQNAAKAADQTSVARPARAYEFVTTNRPPLPPSQFNPD